MININKFINLVKNDWFVRNLIIYYIILSINIALFILGAISLHYLTIGCVILVLYIIIIVLIKYAIFIKFVKKRGKIKNARTS